MNTVIINVVIGCTDKNLCRTSAYPQRNVIRIAGKDRFETAEKVIESGRNSEEYALANGLNFPDLIFELSSINTPFSFK